MFAYLSKKIAIPGGLPLRCISWCAESGWIACGGDNALLKVFCLDGTVQKDAAAAAAAAADSTTPGEAGAGHPSKSLSQNQTLEGHNGAVVCATWNHVHNKLTTSDEAGLIIVWTLCNGSWCEEMINNRNKGVVKDLRWTAAGDKICIAYDDGAVIVGSVDGNRLWGKDLSLQLSMLQWSPAGAYIVFASATGEVHTYDSSGNAVAKVQLFCNEGYNGVCHVVGIEWYAGSRGYAEPGCPVLAICLDNGRMQLMRHDMDDNAVCIDTGMRPNNIKWNHNGSVLAVSGRQTSSDGRELWLVQFYNQAGEHLRTMRVPGSGINDIAWEGNGLRLALAVDSHVFFASVRQPPLWGYFAGTVVYAFSKPDRPEHCVMFWGTHSNDRNTKYVKRVNVICAAGEVCLLVTKGESQGEHILILCNAIGSPVDSKVIELDPKFVALTDSCVVAASEDAVYMWQFRNNFTRQLANEPPNASAGASGSTPAANAGTAAVPKLQREGRERMLHIDSPANAQAPDQLKLSHLNNTADPICAITAHQHLLLVARSSGVVHAFSLPTLSLEGQCVLRSRPQRLLLNCDCSKVAVVDFAGVLSLLMLTQGGPGKLQGEQLSLERKVGPDVWDMCWASDSPELLAIMEKGRLVVLRGSEAEEPITSSAWLAGFSNLLVHAVMLDDIMQQPQTPELNMVVGYETRSLRETRALLAAGQDAEARTFIADNTHPRLWRLLAEHALQQLDLETAEKGFVHCRDMQGLQLVQHLGMLGDKDKQQAEVHVYFKRFDEAEALYRQMDRLDLAITMRSKLGDWFRVEKLLRESGGDDVALVAAWNKIGGYYSDRQKWAKAAQYYTQARNTSMLAQCFYQLEDFASLTKLVEVLTEGQPLLADIGKKLQSVGLCTEAVAAFIKFGDMKAAMDCCMQLHQWDQALQLAQRCNFTEAEDLLQQYAQHLLEKKKYLEAVELYRKADRHSEAARLLMDAAAQLSSRQAPPLQIKKLYVLAALEVEAYRKKALSAAAAGDAGRMGSDGAARSSVLGGAKPAAGAAHTLAGLMTWEASASSEHLKGVDGSAWRGAEAYHFCILAHQQLYAGQVEAALRTALQLRRYDDILDPGLVYAFMALVGFYSGFYGTCSKAFVKLESLPSIPQERREAYADLAMSIFQQHPPADPHSLTEGRDQLSTPAKEHKGKHKAGKAGADVAGDKLQVCVATGRTIKDEPKLRCRTCKHAMIAAELGDRTSCPLCHSSLQQKQDLGSVGSSAMSRSSSMSSSTSRVSKHVRVIG